MTTRESFEEELPGTRRLFDENGSNLPADENLKKSGNIVLIPQPTASPNDPLSWSLPRKIWHSLLVCFVTALTAATSNDAGAAQYNANLDLGISYESFNTAAGVLFIGIGYWTLLSSPMVHLYGRRILYLICMIFGLIGGVWFARMQNVADSILSQLFVGASESVAEAAVQLSLLDLWFQHQVGSVLGIYVLATGVGTYLGPLIASYIADGDLGWRWIGWLNAIFSGGTCVLFLFTLEETAFQRDRYMDNSGERYMIDGVNVNPNGNHDGHNGDLEAEKLRAEKEREEQNRSAQAARASRTSHNNSVSYTTKKTYWQRMRIITPAPNIKGLGFKQYFIRLIHTCRVFTFPAVWYAGIQWGCQNAWLTFYITTEDNLWYEPPWNYSDAAVGNMNIPCIIGVVIGCLYAGYGSDWFMIWMTKRNRGVQEAEMRLYLMYLCACIAPTGLFLFGVGSDRGWDWPVPYVGLGFIGFGYGCAGDISLSYLADAYPEMILEGMVGVAVVNNTIACVFTFVASYWLDGSGTQNTYIAIGVLSFAAIMLSLPMQIWGKKARRWTRPRYQRFLELRDGLAK